ncbi:hypothetical protein FGG78_22920 [Thioclava sp. BHET1]|nr:hypothetical protein FGG78_22920 [Thioclava sp. BHET1]
MRELTVIGNCQALCFAEAIALGAERVKCEFIDVVFKDRPESQDKLKSIIDRATPESTILSFNLSEKMGDLGTEALKLRFPGRIQTFTNLYFSGLHPDLTYFGRMGGASYRRLW